MRSIDGLVLAVALLELAVASDAQSAPAASDLVGTWTGRWVGADGAGGGSVEMIVTGDPRPGPTPSSPS